MRLALALLLLTSPLSAQCTSLTARRFESPFAYGQFGGWDAPRWSHHVVRAGMAVGYVEVAHRVTKVERRKLAWILPALTVVLHVYGASRGHFGWTWEDWIFDAGLSALPLVLTSRDKPLGLSLYGASYALGVCKSSP